MTLTVAARPAEDWGNGDGKINVDNTDGLLVGYEKGNILLFTFDTQVTYQSYNISNLPTLTGLILLTSTPSLGNLMIDDITVGTSQFATNATVDANDELMFISNWNTDLIPIRFNTLTVSVVPEPTTYALIFGCITLGRCLLRRRRCR